MGVVPEEEHGNHSDDLSRTVQRGARVTTGRGPAAGAEGLGRQPNQSFLVLSFPLRYSWFPEGEPAKCRSTRQALSQLDLCRRKSQPGRYSIPSPSLGSFRHRSPHRSQDLPTVESEVLQPAPVPPHASTADRPSPFDPDIGVETFPGPLPIWASPCLSNPMSSWGRTHHI